MTLTYGVNRGPGAAPMFWGDEEPSRADEFAVQALPDARFRESEWSMKVGVTTGAPRVSPVSEPGAGTGVEAQAGSGSWRRRVAPRHRAAVKRFFGQSGEDGK